MPVCDILRWSSIRPTTYLDERFNNAKFFLISKITATVPDIFEEMKNMFYAIEI